MSNEILNWAWTISLKPGPKLVLVCLADMANEKGCCWPKQKTIAQKTGLSLSAVSKHIGALEDEGRIRQSRQRYDDGKMRSSIYQVLFEERVFPCLELPHGEIPFGDLPCGEIRDGKLPDGKMMPHHVANQGNKNPLSEPSLREDISKVSIETSPFLSIELDNVANTQESEINEELHQDITASLVRDSDVVDEVFRYWQIVMKHPGAKLDQKRKSTIQRAYKMGFNLEQQKQAIDGCANTPFNMGRNENQKRYDEISLILRDAEHIERFIQNARANSLDKSLNLAVSQIDQISEGAI